jgi:hypothetical protein
MGSSIDQFLKDSLKVEPHPDKIRIVALEEGITLLGFRVFHYHRLLKRSNARRIAKRFEKFRKLCNNSKMKKEEAVTNFEGWFAYAEFTNTYNLRNMLMNEYNDLLSESKPKTC